MEQTVNAVKKKPAAKKKHHKPVDTSIVMRIGGEDYFYHQIVVVTRHAPTAEILPTELSKTSLSTDGVHPTVVNDKVIRVVRQGKLYRVLTGHAAATEAWNKEGTFKVSVAAMRYLERCMVPPKVLSAEELAKRFESSQARSVRIKKHAAPV